MTKKKDPSLKQMEQSAQVTPIPGLDGYKIVQAEPTRITLSSVTEPEKHLYLVLVDDKWVVEEDPESSSVLPPEIISLIALKVDLATLYNMCQITREFNYLLCGNESFWRGRYLQDLGTPDEPPLSWKSEYYKVLTMSNIIVFGTNINGYLATGLGSHIKQPVQPYDMKIKAAALGLLSVMVIDLDNNVLFRSIGTAGVRPRFTQLEGIKAKAVSSGDYHHIILDRDGSVWGFGSNAFGELGLGPDVEGSPTPLKIPDIKAKQIATGGQFTLLIDLEDNLVVFGNNDSGQLGVGDLDSRFSPVTLPLKVKAIAAGGNFSLAIDMDDNILGFGDNELLSLGNSPNDIEIFPQPIGLKGKAIAAGRHHSIIIDLENNVWTTGVNEKGELGRPQGNVGLGKVEGLKGKLAAGGNYHTLVIDLDDHVYVFGDNRSEQLGIPEEYRTFRPIRIPRLKGRGLAAYHSSSLVIGKYE